jgi:tripartite-type tricarboxylate transporter receptor subunit TctC
MLVTIAAKRIRIFMKTLNKLVVGCLAASFSMIATSAAAADPEPYPTRSIKLIVPFPAGGVGDIVARVLAEKVSTILKQPLVVVNLSGGNSVIGTQAAARAEPDGYTIVQMTNTNVTIPFLQSNVPFNWQTELTPIAGAGELPSSLVVPGKSDINSIDDLIALAKSTPGGIFYGSGSSGTLSHLLAARLAQEMNIQATHVPFSGAAPLQQAAIGNQIHYYFATTLDTLKLAQAKQIRILGVSSENRVAELADVPSLSEQGYLKGNYVVWYGYAAPSNTPKERIARLSDAFKEAVKDPATQARLSQYQFVPNYRDSADFGKFMKDEAQVVKQIIDDNAIKLD